MENTAIVKEQMATVKEGPKAVVREERMVVTEGAPREEKAIVIDIPMGRAVERAGMRWCRRARANGEPCGRPAEEGMDECRWHAEWYSMLPAVFGMPYPEDAVAVHQILARTISMVIGRELTPQQGNAIARLCKELRRNLPWFALETARGRT